MEAIQTPKRAMEQLGLGLSMMGLLAFKTIQRRLKFGGKWRPDFRRLQIHSTKQWQNRFRYPSPSGTFQETLIHAVNEYLLSTWCVLRLWQELTVSAYRKCTDVSWSYIRSPSKKETKMTCLSPSRRPQLQMGTSSFLDDLSPTGLSQLASLVGAGLMLLLMMKMAHLQTANVSGPDQMPEPDHVLVGYLWGETAFCSSPVVAPGYFWFLS